jgi:nucleotide-binding universal stress UspA family protein
MFETVLYPIAQTRESIEAAGMVAQVVNLCHSRLVILSVVDQELSEADQAAADEAIAVLLGEVKTLFEKQGITAETQERTGNPAFTICDVADEINANVIIMGCRGLGLTEEGMADSVTNRVINLAPCPVLIVP